METHTIFQEITLYYAIFDNISYVKTRHYGDLFKTFVGNLETGLRSTKAYIPCKQLYFRIRMTFFWAQTFTRKHIVFLVPRKITIH